MGGAESRRTPAVHLVDPPVLHLISPQVLPHPADWKASASLTGFCFLEPRTADGAILPTPYSPDREMSAFLEGGPAPFDAGFGSMISRDPEALATAVVAFFADQPAWGRTLEQLGVSPATHRLSSLSAEALAASIRALAGEPRFRQRARELQQLLAREDGVACTASAIEARLAGMR